MAVEKNSYRKIRVFVAFPGDLAAEHKRLAHVIERLNRGIADHFHFILEMNDWHMVSPGMGRPEAVILNQLPVEKWDIFIGILWKRFGTPTGGVDSKSGEKYESGTEEEFKLAYESWEKTGKPHIMFYQCKRIPDSIDEIDPDQLKRVNNFFAQFAATGKHPGLNKSYQAIEDFEDLVHDHLVNLLKEYNEEFDRPSPIRPAPISEPEPEPEPDVHRVIFKDKEYIYIPSGPFTIGSNQRQLNELITESRTNMEKFSAEFPQHNLNLEGYYIARFPVTNAEYFSFIKATDNRVPYRDDEWSQPYNWAPNTRTYPTGKGDHPVVLISWYDAQAYCRWIGGRLPTEAEWEKAARGADLREWPWGSKWQEDRCNTIESGLDSMTPVGKFSPRGDSPYGVSDMAGNTWEWCSSLLDPYPYNPTDGRENLESMGKRVLRGGALGLDRFVARCAFRGGTHPGDYGFSIGFRVVLSSHYMNQSRDTINNER